MCILSTDLKAADSSNEDLTGATVKFCCLLLYKLITVVKAEKISMFYCNTFLNEGFSKGLTILIIFLLVWITGVGPYTSRQQMPTTIKIKKLLTKILKKKYFGFIYLVKKISYESQSKIHFTLFTLANQKLYLL